MRINHNIAALNTHRQLNSATTAQSKSMEKLASGMRINKAGDDAAGLAISEKMRGQIRGLDQASKNSQDGISMIATAEGALNETHDILQRMRELATQASNDTNVGVDRDEIQKEINQLSSEINRIGNTTEFNTQGVLKGDGGIDLAKTSVVTNASVAGTTTNTQASAAITVTAKAATDDVVKMDIGGEKFEHTFTADDIATITALGDAAYSGAVGSGGVKDAARVAAETAATATAIDAALDKFIEGNEKLKGQFTSTNNGAAVTIAAVSGGAFAGAKGSISAATVSSIGTATATAGVGTTTNTSATSNIDFGSIVKTASGAVDKTASTKTLTDLVGKGFEINGTKVEFYNVNDGAYKGDALGVDISKALDAVKNATATSGAVATDRTAIQNAFTAAVADQIGDKVKGAVITAGAAGAITVTSTATGTDAKLEIKDGAVKKEFEATFQVGANKGQSMTISISDMRSEALGITGKAGATGFTAANSVTDGTNNTANESALDVSSHKSASAAIEVINKAIETVSSERSKLGAFQNRLEHTINNLNTSSENLTAAESRVRDVDMAKEMMEQTKSSILSQAAQAMLAQANQMPQGVLQLLR
ncbi:flagellin [Sporosarcina psychrophila]|uniref:flagellin N-terminal helical domain-containing protein n=1 Tax=Sporosarcina psychrophila TaxID=1476 RepID=UPI0030CA8E55